MKSKWPKVSLLATILIAIFTFGGLLSTPIYVRWLETQREFPFFIYYFWPLVLSCLVIVVILGGYQLHKFLQNQKSKNDVFFSFILVLVGCIGIVGSLYASYSSDIVECREIGGEVHHKSFGRRPFIIQCLDENGKNMFNMWYEKDDTSS